MAGLLPLLTGASDNPLAEVKKTASSGFSVLTVLLNAAMKFEREKHIGVAPYERDNGRSGHANGFKDRTLSTRLGQLNVAIPHRFSASPKRPAFAEAMKYSVLKVWMPRCFRRKH